MLHSNMSFDEYLALDGWNWSCIKLLEKQSPKAVRLARDGHLNSDTASRGMLRAVHTMVFEPHRFEADYALYGGKVRRGKEFEAFKACNPGKTILNVREVSEAAATAEAIRNNAVVAPFLQSGRGEVVVTWDDEETGLPCKARLDWLDETSLNLVDLKTIGAVDEIHVGRIVAQNLYHGQMAHYVAGLRANGLNVDAYIIAAEGKGAHDVGVFRLDSGGPDGALYAGELLRRRLLNQLDGHIEDCAWGGRYAEPQSLILPSWALNDDVEV